MKDLIKGLLEVLQNIFGKDNRKPNLPQTSWEYWEEQSEYLKSKGLLEDQELLALQPSHSLGAKSPVHTSIYDNTTFDSYQEFESSEEMYLNDKHLCRFNQILYWSIQSNIGEDGTENEEPQYSLQLLMFHPRRNMVETLLIKVTKTDLPKIKKMLRKAALFNFYNFSQAFK
jgi:hypothetical protein